MESCGSSLLHWRYSWGREQVWWTGFLSGPNKSCLLYKCNIEWEDGKEVVRGALVDVSACGGCSSLEKFLWMRISAEKWVGNHVDGYEHMAQKEEYLNNKRGVFFNRLDIFKK